MSNEIRTRDIKKILRSKGGHHLSSLDIDHLSGMLEEKGNTIKKHELRRILDDIHDKDNRILSDVDAMEVENVLMDEDNDE